MTVTLPGFSRLLLITSLLASASFSQARSDFPITVLGADEGSFQPQKTGNPTIINDPSHLDAIVVGGGLAGLSAALYLGDQEQKVALLEKDATLGGIAAGGELEGVRYARGAAYWTKAAEEEHKIFERIGLGDYQKKYSIPEPIDSYLWNGKFYEGLWEEKTLKALPSSFALFKHALALADQAGLIPVQPIEESKNLDLDSYTAADWVRRMPQHVSELKDETSKQIYQKYKQELLQGKLNRKDPMIDVLNFLDLYCRSALGTTTQDLSALALANFYITELETRYATPTGTGIAAERLIEALKQQPQVTLKTSTKVEKIISHPDRVEVLYTNAQGELHRITAPYLVFSTQLRLAPWLIQDFHQVAPEQAKLIETIQYTGYAVHGVAVKGHPYRSTFDTWARPVDYTEKDFADVILGRWMDPNLLGYQGFRDFKKSPTGPVSVLTIYHPMKVNPFAEASSKKESALRLAQYDVQRLVEQFSSLLKRNWGTALEVLSVQTTQWPYSIHLVNPGHFKKAAKILRRPLGRIYFANNNMGMPAIEEALFRGHCAANNILFKKIPGFKQEAWTQCPIEK